MAQPPVLVVENAHLISCGVPPEGGERGELPGGDSQIAYLLRSPTQAARSLLRTRSLRRRAAGFSVRDSEIGGKGTSIESRFRTTASRFHSHC